MYGGAGRKRVRRRGVELPASGFSEMQRLGRDFVGQYAVHVLSAVALGAIG